MGWQRRGLPRWYCLLPRGLLHYHPTRMELFLSSFSPKVPLLSHPNPRTSENKEEMLLAKPKLDGAGLGAKARTKRGLSLGLAPPLLNVGATGRDTSLKGP